MAQLHQNGKATHHSLIDPVQYLLQGEIYGTTKPKCIQIRHQAPSKEDAVQLP